MFPSHDRWCHWIERKHAKAEMMDPGYITDLTNTSPAYQHVNRCLGLTKKQNFTFAHSTWDYHITENAEDERWTLMGTTPAIERNLCLLAGVAGQRGGAGDFRGVYDIRCYYHIVYTVQLRELKDDILYKGVGQPTSE